MAEHDTRRTAAPHEPGDHGIGHGNSLAAWIAVGVILVGSLVSCVAVVGAIVWLFWVGVAVIVLGMVLGRVLSMMGFGQKTETAAGRHPGG